MKKKKRPPPPLLKSHLCANLSRRRLIDDTKGRTAQANLGCHFSELLASVQAFRCEPGEAGAGGYLGNLKAHVKCVWGGDSNT